MGKIDLKYEDYAQSANVIFNFMTKPEYLEEILEKKDFYNKVVVVNENDKLVLQEKKIFPIQYLCIVLTAVVLIIRILAGFIKKR